MKNELRNKIERYKEKIKLFSKNQTKVFLKDINSQIYMGFIKEVLEDTFIIKTFAPPEKKDQEFSIYFIDVTNLSEYKSKEELKQ